MCVCCLPATSLGSKSSNTTTALEREKTQLGSEPSIRSSTIGVKAKWCQLQNGHDGQASVTHSRNHSRLNTIPQRQPHFYRDSAEVGVSSRGDGILVNHCTNTGACQSEERKIGLVHIQPGRPVQNGHVESSHGRLRDECLNPSWLRTLNDVRRTLDRSREEYNGQAASLGAGLPHAARISGGDCPWECGTQRALPTFPIGTITTTAGYSPLSQTSAYCSIFNHLGIGGTLQISTRHRRFKPRSFAAARRYHRQTPGLP